MTMRLLALPLLMALAGCGGSDNLPSLSEQVAEGDSSRRTVLFDVSYVGVGIERQQDREGLQEVPGTAADCGDRPW